MQGVKYDTAENYRSVFYPADCRGIAWNIKRRGLNERSTENKHDRWVVPLADKAGGYTVAIYQQLL